MAGNTVCGMVDHRSHQGNLVAPMCYLGRLKLAAPEAWLKGFRGTMINDWVPWALAAGNATSALLTGKGKLAGWPVLAATQLAFIAYAFATNQVGFILQNVVMIGIAVYNAWLWTRPKSEFALGLPPGKHRRRDV